MNLSTDPYSSELPTATATGQNIYVIWLNNTFGDSGHYSLLFRAGKVNGSLDSILNLSNQPSANVANPSIVALGSYVYVVWQANLTKTNDDIFFRASADNGTSFGPAINLSNDSADSTVPSLAAAGTNVVVAWQTSTNKSPIIGIISSANHGTSFSNVIQMGNSAFTSLDPQVAASGSNVYVTWRYNTNGNPQTFFSRSTDNGGNFSAPVSLSKSVTGETDIYQTIIAVGSNVYVSWTNDTLTNDETMFVSSVNGGQSFSGPMNLSNNPTASFKPQLAASGSYVYDLWTDVGPNKNTDIFCRVSSSNGASFAKTINISNTTGTSSDPAIAAWGSSVDIAWDDSTPGRDQTFLSFSADAGNSFTSYQNLSNDTGFATNPYVSATSTSLVIVWQDDSLGNNEIFERRATLSSAPTVMSQTVATTTNQSLIVHLSGSDPLGLQLTFSIIGGPIHGILGPITSTGPNTAQVTYTPKTNYTGADSFSFKANDGISDSSPGSVTLLVETSTGSGLFGGNGRVVLM